MAVRFGLEAWMRRPSDSVGEHGGNPMTKKKSKNHVPKSLNVLFPNVRKVVEATEPIEISVTSADVRSARKMEADGCAMAKAICRLKRVTGAVVGLSNTYVVEGDVATRYKTSVAV